MNLKNIALELSKIIPKNKFDIEILFLVQKNIFFFVVGKYNIYILKFHPHQ